MLPAAMLLGAKRLRVGGRVSPRLAHGLREYHTSHLQWWPKRMSPVEVEYDQVAVDPRGGGDGVGCTCSGGIDSSYSIFRHMPANESLPGARLTHCLIINGFNWDWDLDRAREFQRVYETFAPIIRRNGMELLTVRQNVQNFLFATGKVTHWKGPIGMGLSCAALVLGRLFRRFYIPSAATYRYEDNYPHNFHPSILHLMGTEYTEVFFDGGDATRAEKTEAIASWEDMYSALRVCWRATVFNEETGLFENCGRCPKCVRTMITLDLLGVLGRYRTFPHPLERARVRRSGWVSANARVYYNDLIVLARRMGRTDMERDLRAALLRGRATAAIRHRVLRRRRPS